VSPRRLSGWEPAEVTTYEYDGDRLVRAVTIREPEFSTVDTAALLEARRRARVRRGPHGYTIAEATDPDNQFAFVAKPRQDWAMRALNQAQEAYKRDNPGATDLSSLVWDVKKRS
jgi:hypothetical protein